MRLTEPGKSLAYQTSSSWRHYMRKALLMAGALLALTAATAAAQVNLSWDFCAENGVVLNKTTTCASNSGGQTMVASWYPPAAATAVTAIEVYLDYQVNAATLGCWWTFAGTVPAGRSNGALVSAADGTDIHLCAGNYFRDNAGPSAGGWVQTAPARGAFRFAVAAAEALDPDDVEQFGISVRIQNAATVGSCTGCTTPACFVLNRVVVNQQGGNIEMTDTALGQHVTWRSAGTLACPAATPTKKATWGSIKALYR